MHLKDTDAATFEMLLDFMYDGCVVSVAVYLYGLKWVRRVVLSFRIIQSA